MDVTSEMKELSQLLGTKVNSLESGESFGELALIDDKSRGSTLISASDGYLLTLCREDYIEILKTKENIILEQKAFIIKQIFIFCEWELYTIKKLAYYLKETQYQFNELI